MKKGETTVHQRESEEREEEQSRANADPVAAAERFKTWQKEQQAMRAKAKAGGAAALPSLGAVMIGADEAISLMSSCTTSLTGYKRRAGVGEARVAWRARVRARAHRSRMPASDGLSSM